MKKLFLLAALCAPLASFAQGGEFTIRLKADGDVKESYLVRNTPRGRVVDTVRVTDGVLTHKGTLPGAEPVQANLILVYNTPAGAPPSGMQTPIFLEPGTIEVFMPADYRNITITGTPMNDEAAEWKTLVTPLASAADKIGSDYKAMTPADQQANRDRMQAEHLELQGKMKALAASYIAEHSNSLFALTNLFGMAMGTSPADGQKLLDSFSAELRNSPLGKQRQAALTAMMKTAVGSMAPEIVQLAVDGKEFKLSDLRGEWVLIDFWASWCGPCRGENPNVVAAYEAFKDKGFTILGVSLDENREAWLKAIEDDKLNWHQVSDLKGWSNAAAADYAVRAIPANFLINPKGEIVATNLRGQMLHTELAKHLK